MSWFQGGRNVSIRTRLFVLFAVPVLVIVSSRTWELTQEYRARLTTAYERTLTLTRTGIERQEGVISEIRGLLQVLGRVPDITNGSASNCRRLLSEITQDKPWLKGLWIVEPSGQSVCSTVLGGVGLDFSDKHYFRKAVETRTFAIEHYWVGRLRGMPAAVAALPVVDRTGAVTKIIMASFDLAWLVSIQDEVTRSAGATFLLIDESGTVLARYPEIESLAERNFANHPLVQAMRGVSQGQFEKPDLDGEQRIFGFAQLPGTNSRLVIGFSRSKILEAINWQTIMSVISLFIVCALGLVVAWVGGEKLIATKLREQNLRLEAAKVQLDAAMNNMPHGLCMFDGDQRMVVCNTKYAEMYGLQPEHTTPGTTLREILKLRVEKGNSPESAEEYIEERIREVSGGVAYTKQNELRDGRILSIMHQPMANGGWVAIHQDITEQKTIEKKIAHMAHHDALTGLPNRILLREQLEHVLSYGPRGQTLAVLCLDLDHFKNVNDTLGHPVGDSLLRHVADRLRGCLRDTDIVARLGGDEFAIVQVGTEQPVGATILAQRVIDVMSATFEVDGHQLVIGTSVGIAIAPSDGTEPDQLLRNADMALYRAKADGRNASRFFETAMDAKMQERRSLELDLRKALVASEFELVYQPQVNSRTYEVAGFEALLR